ncbi:MAG: MotA/TolQ/ExbB proton channel family protein [Planctomycetota bacterium]|jgi:biopolymer transport protein ExbB
MIPVFVQVSKFLTTTLGCLAIVSWFGASEAWAQNIRWSPSPPASPSNYPSTSNGGTYANPATNFPNSVRQNGNIATSDPRIAALPAPGSSSVGSNVTYSSGANPTATTAEASTGKIPTRNLLQVFHDGGWMMYPIALCSFGLTVFAFERWIALRRSRVVSKPFVNRIIEQLQQQLIDRDEAIELCEKSGTPMAKIMIAALRRHGRPAVEVEQAVLDTGERESNFLRRNMRAILAISNVSPLLGLLGTVLGMIQSFNDISNSQAMGRPELLAGGISQALLTTAAGLLVAIPAYATYVFFIARIDSLIIEMDAHAQKLVDVISAEGLQENEGTRTRRSRKAA